MTRRSSDPSSGTSVGLGILYTIRSDGPLDGRLEEYYSLPDHGGPFGTKVAAAAVGQRANHARRRDASERPRPFTVEQLAERPFEQPVERLVG